jgi:putative restriction endonuclease
MMYGHAATSYLAPVPTAPLPAHLRLRRANGRAPHKPVLLLAVMKAIELGVIDQNRIEPNADLINLFHGYWRVLVPEGTFQKRFFLPFYFLKNDVSRIWTFHAAPGFEATLTHSKTPKSLSSLIHFGAWAELHPEIYQRWLRPEYRLFDALELMRFYFPGTALPEALPDHLQDLAHQIIHLDRDQYMAQQLQLPADEEEEEQLLRSNAFKRTIPRIYDHQCAITGLRIQDGDRMHLIDACHIVPWADSFDDTVGNGIALSPTMHRAFDRGLISIAADLTVLVTARLQENESAHAIRPFVGKPLFLPMEPRYLPALENLAWHRGRWGYV